MAVTVGEYIVGEGLAESVATELYGEGVVGFYVTDLDEAELERARRVLGGALDLTGFDEVRSCMFGDALARYMGLPPAGVPDYAGYAVGYRLVQRYLRRCGRTGGFRRRVPARSCRAWARRSRPRTSGTSCTVISSPRT
jgi:uncharacterized protein YjaZ